MKYTIQLSLSPYGISQYYLCTIIVLIGFDLNSYDKADAHVRGQGNCKKSIHWFHICWKNSFNNSTDTDRPFIWHVVNGSLYTGTQYWAINL